MRKILAICQNALIRMGRDRKTLILFLLMPLLLVGILGMTLKEVMTVGKINPFDVVIINEDRAAPLPMPGAPPLHLGKVLVDEVLLSDGVRELITLTTAPDLAEAKQQVADGEAAAAIYVPTDFSAQMVAGKRAEVQLFTDPARATQADIVGQIVRSFTDQVTAGAVAAALGGPHGVPVRVELPVITQKQAGARAIGALEYYAAGMAVMYMLMSAIQRSKNILEERDLGTMARTLISPTPTWVVLAGHTLATAVLLSLQFLLLLIGTSLLYGVHWGPWLPVLLIGLSFAIASAGIATGLASVFRDPKAADTGVGLLGMVFGALSGSMFPLWIFPDLFVKVARAIPNYWALQGFLDQMAGLGVQYAWLPVIILCITGVATGALGAWWLATR